jgi:glucose dehydrogenase
MHQMMTKRLNSLLWTVSLVTAGIAWIAPDASAQSRGASSEWRQKDTEWASYTADIRGSRYRPLDQINASNFNKLEIAWRFKTDNLGPFPEYKLEGTPLMVNGVLFTTGGTRRSVIALDAKTGELIWVHSLREGRRAAVSPRQLSGRGVSYWSDGHGDDRVIYMTTGYRLVELNAKTDAVINSFGAPPQGRYSQDRAGSALTFRPVTIGTLRDEKAFTGLQVFRSGLGA